MSRLKINALNGSSDGGDGGDGGDRVADKGESQRKCAASRPWVGIRRRLDAWKMHWAEVNYLYLLFVLFSLIKFFVRFFFVLPVLSISLFFVFFFGGFELRMQKCNMPQCNGDTKVQHQPLTAAVEWVCLRSCRDVQQQRWLCSLFFIFCTFFLYFLFHMWHLHCDSKRSCNTNGRNVSGLRLSKAWQAAEPKCIAAHLLPGRLAPSAHWLALPCWEITLIFGGNCKLPHTAVAVATCHRNALLSATEACHATSAMWGLSDLITVFYLLCLLSFFVYPPFQMSFCICAA